MSESLQLFPFGEIIPDYQELYRKVYDQICKDFHPHAEALKAPAQLSSEWLSNELHRMLVFIVERKTAELGPILYRVDLSEKLVRSAMHSALQKDKITDLVSMILKREAQKVWFRHTLK